MNGPSNRSTLGVFVPRPRRQRERAPALVDIVPDEAQRALIESSDPSSLLVLGEAGHGKTTILVLRVAHLFRRSLGRLRVAIIVPTDGLVRLLQPLFRRLGVDVAVRTYDDFAAEQARRAFRFLPKESELTPPGVARLKRHPALRAALEELARRDPGVLDEDHDRPVRKTRKHVSRGDLQHLFGDRVLMESVARAASLPERAVREVLDRTRVQTGPTGEQEWAHVTDAERLQTVDGRKMDDGTATEHANTLDVEDYAVLFELDRLRALRRQKPPTMPRPFDLVAIDEAQEFAPLELALLGRSLAPNGTLVVSGDADQQTDATATFYDWETTLRELGCPSCRVERLHIGYRCPPQVVALARAVRDGLSSTEPAAPSASKGAPIAFRSFPDERALCAVLGPEMEQILRRDRRASMVVVCREPLTARRLAGLLRAWLPTRLVFDGRFLPRGPLQVSTIDEVKGLEFDYVVLADANAASFPENAASRRTLYVALTRARFQLVVARAGEGSPVIPWP